MIVNEKESRFEFVLCVAKAMMGAARTAPKSKGKDRLDIITVHGDGLAKLAKEMREQSKRSGIKFFLRDAMNVEAADAVVLIGSGIGSFGLNCGFCGFPTCAEKNRLKDVPCALNMNDLGIAVGSAASIAADNRVDSRVMFSVARAALNLGMLDGSCTAAFGIVMSCTGKSPFFDRTVHKEWAEMGRICGEDNCE